METSRGDAAAATWKFCRNRRASQVPSSAGEASCVAPGTCTAPDYKFSRVAPTIVPGQQWNINGGYDDPGRNGSRRRCGCEFGDPQRVCTQVLRRLFNPAVSAKLRRLGLAGPRAQGESGSAWAVHDARGQNRRLRGRADQHRVHGGRPGPVSRRVRLQPDGAASRRVQSVHEISSRSGPPHRLAALVQGRSPHWSRAPRGTLDGPADLCRAGAAPEPGVAATRPRRRRDPFAVSLRRVRGVAATPSARRDPSAEAPRPVRGGAAPAPRPGCSTRRLSRHVARPERRRRLRPRRANLRHLFETFARRRNRLRRRHYRPPIGPR